MSGEMRGLRFGFTTYDVQHWPEAELRAAEVSGAVDLVDWVQDQLERVALDAMNRWAAEHSGVLACEVT